MIYTYSAISLRDFVIEVELVSDKMSENFRRWIPGLMIRPRYAFNLINQQRIPVGIVLSCDRTNATKYVTVLWSL
jgi:hypothetical protein